MTQHHLSSNRPEHHGNVRKKCRVPQIEFRFILNERQEVRLCLLIIDRRKPHIERPDDGIFSMRTERALRRARSQENWASINRRFPVSWTGCTIG